MSPRAAQVRIYVDADVLGLGKLLAGLRSDVTYPGDPGAVIHKRQRAPCPITSPDVLDTDWIPQVAASSTRTARSAVRHLHAAISSFTPLNMARHGVADDTGRIAGKRLMAQAHRHLLLAKDLADAP